ncbi:MAG: hypothetical protein LLF94_08760, partial [Chlamydiales bacterium]|nr:hypothetical protein [Chlamydiales bacterium]
MITFRSLPLVYRGAATGVQSIPSVHNVAATRIFTRTFASVGFHEYDNVRKMDQNQIVEMALKTPEEKMSRLNIAILHRFQICLTSRLKELGSQETANTLSPQEIKAQISAIHTQLHTIRQFL